MLERFFPQKKNKSELSLQINKKKCIIPKRDEKINDYALPLLNQGKSKYFRNLFVRRVNSQLSFEKTKLNFFINKLNPNNKEYKRNYAIFEYSNPNKVNNINPIKINLKRNRYNNKNCNKRYFNLMNNKSNFKFLRNNSLPDISRYNNNTKIIFNNQLLKEKAFNKNYESDITTSININNITCNCNNTSSRNNNEKIEPLIKNVHLSFSKFDPLEDTKRNNNITKEYFFKTNISPSFYNSKFRKKKYYSPQNIMNKEIASLSKKMNNNSNNNKKDLYCICTVYNHLWN